jgi:hypothetical protein
VKGCTGVSGAPGKNAKREVDFLGVFFGSLRFFERSGGAKCELIRHLDSFLGVFVLPTYLVETTCL